ncbi:hypothetical protein BVG19_g4510 [[Candida] boidinii]|nr:hypothetical protein BVG19_g4510 [[Candida] boidinii]OWB53732.1 hypothetical protein B5S27_g5340 [[Candida] boidinii]
MAGSHSHRTTLKRKNKNFKSAHSSKRSLKAANKGRVEGSVKGGKGMKTPSKIERKNLANQIKANKIMKSLNERNLFSSSSAAERIVTVIPLTSNISAIDIINQLLSPITDEEFPSITSEPSITSVKIKKFKANLKFIIPDKSNLISILDACKVSDFVILALSATEEIDPKVGEQIIRSIELQGISTVIGIIPDVVQAYPKKNLQQDVVKSLTSFYTHFFPNTEKLYTIENSSDALNAIRTLCQKFPKSITWRDNRGYLVADNIASEQKDPNNQMEGYIVVEGVARGLGFNADRLIHLPGFGDFQLAKIEKLVSNQRKLNNNNEDINMNSDSTDNFFPTENRDTLDELLPIEEINEDEEWDVDEMNEDMERNYNSLSGGNIQSEKPKRLPKGISEYQAKWYLEDDLEDLIDEHGLQSDDDDEEVMYDDEEVEMQMDENDGRSGYEPSEMFVELTPEEEAKQLELYQRRAKDDLDFPDEIELNMNESAQKRLARYRGVKSLANCEWDFDESDPKRPSEWERYLRISNFKATKSKILKEYIRDSQVQAGERVRLYIEAPSYILERIQDPKIQPFVVYGLLEHEHKLGICNFSIQTWEGYDQPLKSKESIIVQYGPRRQVISPLYSGSTRNANNVAKFQRYLHPGNVSIATAITPVMFTNTPAIFYRQDHTTGQIEMIGQGTFLNTDHTRILAKRVVLTGEIFKIHKNVVTIRYMFFNSDDVINYKYIPLFTKMGRSGLIKESLGTHGYFKAIFDGKLNAQDIVGMSLYKRLWPKVSIMHQE